MANDVRIRFKSHLPGSGFDSAGGAKQGKTRVVGQVNVTSYGGAEGEPLSAVDLGLTTIDQISLRHRDEATGAASHALGAGQALIRGVIYSRTTGHFYLFTTDSNGENTGIANGNSVAVLEFVAEGDSAVDVELT